MDWQLLITGSLGALVTFLLGAIAYIRIPKKDIGAVAKSTVEAAGEANDLLREAIDDLKVRVTLLEKALIERDETIEDLKREVRWYERWFEAVISILVQNGVDFPTLEEIRARWPDG